MRFLNMPDYLSHASLDFWQAGWQFLQFVVFFYFSLFVVILLNFLIVAVVSWGLLMVFRLLGKPWVDGTTKGFINRR